MKNNPYIGPRPYDREDRGSFYGRKREARDLVSKIVAERVVLFYAQSGAGKSSILNAQVIPALEERNFYVLPVARVGGELPPGINHEQVDNIFVFSTLTELADPDTPVDMLTDHTLLSFLRQRCPKDDDDNYVPPILIWDQFEEIFTTHRERWQEARGFFQQVRKAMHGIPNLGVVFAMREDYVASMDTYASLLPRRLRTRFRMERLGPKGALEAITKPAINAGCSYDPGVAERMIDDMRRVKVQHTNEEGELKEQYILGPYVEPVQLQVICSQLWDNLPEQGDYAIQWEEVEQYGNIDRALTDFYENAVEAAVNETSARERKIRWWFAEQLITPMETRGLVLRGRKETAELPNAAVDVLEERRMIRADVRAGTRWYEICHDRLVEPILESNQDWEAARETPLRTAARRWGETGEDSLLYHEDVLAEALAWAATNADEVEPYEREFLEASQLAEQEHIQARKRRRVLIGVFSIVGVIILMLSVVAMWQWQAAEDARDEAQHAAATAVAESTISAIARATAEAAKDEADNRREEAEQAKTEAEQARAKAEGLARLALSRQMALQSTYELEKNNYQLASLLAIEAGSMEETTEAFAALHQVLTHLGRPPLILSGHEGSVWQAEWNGDGNRILTASDDGTTRVWNAVTGQELLDISGDRAMWSADESRLLTTECDQRDESSLECLAGRVRVWNATRGVELIALPGGQAQWNADESRILTAGCEQISEQGRCEQASVRMWDLEASAAAATREEILTLPGDWGIWNTDESRILTTGCDRRDDAGSCEEATAWVWDIEASVAATTAETPTLEATAILSGHVGSIRQAEWNASENRILTTSDDGTVRVWNAFTGEETLILSGYEGRVEAEWNAYGSHILITSGAPNYTAQLWNAITATKPFTFSSHTGAIWQATWNTNGGRILTAGCDRMDDSGEQCEAATVRVWDTWSGAELLTLGAEDTLSDGWSGVNVAVWNADESQILTASWDDTTQVWNAWTGAETLTLSGDWAMWSTDESQILTKSGEDTARVWDAVTGEETLTLSGVRQAVWNKDESRILITGDDGTVTVWDVATGSELPSFSGDQAQWNGDESRILTTECNQMNDQGECLGSTIRVWDTVTGEELLTLLIYESGIWQAVWNADESQILTKSDDGVARVWGIKTSETIITETELFVLDADRVEWNAGKDRILTSRCNHQDDAGLCEEATVQVWDASTGEESLTLPDQEYLNEANWTTDGNHVLTTGCDRRDDAGSCEQAVARVWDLEALATATTEEETHTFSDDMVEWNADTDHILTARCHSQDDSGSCEQATVRVWDTVTGEEKFSASGNMGWVEATWNADGSRVLTIDGYPDYAVRVRDTAMGEETFTLSGHTNAIHQAQWNGDESRILTFSSDGTTRLWDAATGEEMFTLSGSQARWNSDESQILTTGCDQVGDSQECLEYAARVWDAVTGVELFAFAGYTDQINQAEWNADESRILVTSNDGTVRQYHTRMEDLRDVACQRTSRNMTWEEWQRHLADASYRQTCAQLPRHSSIIKAKIDQAEAFALFGSSEVASRAYERAIEWTSDISDGNLYETVCRSASLHGFAELVLPVCERAVELMPSSRDSRGLARALTGDVMGAIEDFTSAVEQWQEAGAEEYAQFISDRESWIAQLAAGENPFNEQTIETLRNEN
ncbi:MAG: hypothetical protein GY832_43655 [Chloroflexi bacterium]|nr:hypothetical protein [Chloroflexota bacterium]